MSEAFPGSADVEKSYSDGVQMSDDERGEPLWFCPLDENGRYGYCCSSGYFMIWLCGFTIMQSCATSGLIAANINDIERRYGLDSTSAGLIMGLYDVVVIGLVAMVSYYGARGHKPRILGLGLFCVGFGSLCFSMPQWFSDKYSPSISNASYELCGPSSASPSETCGTSPSGLYVFFLIGITFMGIGAAPLYTLGTVFIDENVEPDTAPLYMGIFYACSALGPAIGFVAGGMFLSKWVDGGTPPGNPPLTQDSNLWVGAWWIAFVLQAMFSFVLCVPLTMYPKHLPNTSHLRKQVVEVERPSSMLDDLKALLTNPVFVFNALGTTSESFVVSGFSLFLPKVVAALFKVPNAVAAMGVGACLVPGACCGMVSSGWIIGKFNLAGKKLAIFTTAVGVIAFFFCFMFTITCPNTSLAGLTTPYGNSTLTKLDNGQPNFVSGCNKNCNCDTFAYDPVCGADDTVYFNPCMAGCKQKATKDGSVLAGHYTNCKCIEDNQGTAERGFCKSSCNSMGMYFFLLFLVMFFTFMNNVPATQVTLQSLPANIASFGMGVQSMTFRLLGSVPGPVLLGYYIDDCCSWWGLSCGEKGACRQYDNKVLTSTFVTFALLGKLMSFLFFGLSAYFCDDSKMRLPDTSSPAARRAHTRASLSSASGGRFSLMQESLAVSSQH